MKKIKRQIYKYLPYLKPLSLILIGILLFFLLRLLAPSIYKLVEATIQGPKLAYSLLAADTSSLNSSNNRTNILILGVSGGNNLGNDLTDTMIFMSLDKSNADTVMLSIPRDIWLDSMQAKINTAYHYGEENSIGKGFALAKDAVYEVFNQPIHYAVLIDFEGFIKIIDLLEGLDIKIDKSFDDFKYPISGKEEDDCDGDLDYKCRYEHLHFDAGVNHMDGETALMFVRSRNAKGDEGTDFARSQRQQKVILALKDKIFSLKLLFNPKKIGEIKKTLGEHVKFDTQFTQEQTTAFLSLLLRFIRNGNSIRTIALDFGDEENLGFLFNPPIEEYGQWVLAPRAGDWSEVHKYVEDKIFKGY
ncbi:LCP family protein [Patescibacteria group bacterium]